MFPTDGFESHNYAVIRTKSGASSGHMTLFPASRTISLDRDLDIGDGKLDFIKYVL